MPVTMTNQNDQIICGTDNPNPCSVCGTLQGYRVTANRGCTFCYPCYLNFRDSVKATYGILEYIKEQEVTAKIERQASNNVIALIFLLTVLFVAGAVIIWAVMR